MTSHPRTFRTRVLSLAALTAHVFQACADRLRGRRRTAMPNCTRLEPGLYLGGLCDQPPEGAQAVLSVTPTPDAFTVNHHRWQPIAGSTVPTIK